MATYVQQTSRLCDWTKSREQPQYASNFRLIALPTHQRPYRKVRPSRRLKKIWLCVRVVTSVLGESSKSSTGAIKAMRSELVFAAERSLPNRYSLCRLVSTATRKFHRPNTRIEETTDLVLRRIAKANAGVVELDNAEIQVETLLLGTGTAY